MTQDQTGPRSAPQGARWAIGAGVGAFAVLAVFLTTLAMEIRFVGPSGAVGLALLGIAGAGGFAALALGPVGRAIARRIFDPADAPPELAQEIEALRLDGEELRRGLTEMHDRLDFAERLLTTGKDGDAAGVA